MEARVYPDKQHIDALAVNDNNHGVLTITNKRATTQADGKVLALDEVGNSNQMIAAKLTIAVGTIKGHLAHIYRKLSVRNRTGAVAKPRPLGLLTH